MPSKKFGEAKGPFIVWFFFTLYFAITMLFRGSSSGTFPSNVTTSLILGLLIGMLMSYGVVLAFLVIFLALWEKRRSLKEIISSIGLKKEGSVESIFWSVALFPLLIAVGSLLIVLSSFLGPVPFLSASIPNSEQIPLWYRYYMIIYSFFPVAIVEEAFSRGYMLDRLIPLHPSSLVKALPAMLLSSFLFTLWHVPGYLIGYQFSIPWVVGLLAGNVFPISLVLSMAYVRARKRNIIGPVFIHFLLDAMPIILALTST